jgi:hypothetical protein
LRNSPAKLHLARNFQIVCRFGSGISALLFAETPAAQDLRLLAQPAEILVGVAEVEPRIFIVNSIS